MAARRAAGVEARRRAVRDQAVPAVELLYEALSAEAEASAGLPDIRLRLLFACAHPAIEPGVRAPLMLQTVLGLKAEDIASAYLVAPAAMGQRLVRAKAKIRDAGIGFETPPPEAFCERLADVLVAIYAAYGLGWEGLSGAEASAQGLAEETIFLARTLIKLLPEEPEPKGLLALMLYSEARREARRGADGAFIPLKDQDAGLWSRPMIAEAEAVLTEAARAGRPGRFQTEAAIQSLHTAQAAGARPPPRALLSLYDLLVTQTAALGPQIARAAAYGSVIGPEAGLAILDPLSSERVAGYQPYWAARFTFLAALDRPDAEAARARAIALARDQSVKAFLESR